MMLDEPTPIRCCSDLADYIKRRKEELCLSNELVEEKCGLTRGHVDKLVGPSREKALSQFTVDLFLQFFAFELIPRPDPQQEALMRPKWERREECQVRTGGPRRVSKTLLELTRPILQQAFGKMGNEARNRVLSSEHRSEIARRAAQTRWQKHRRARRELAVSAARACEERAP